jgi:hypothetical protein
MNLILRRTASQILGTLLKIIFNTPAARFFFFLRDPIICLIVPNWSTIRVKLGHHGGEAIIIELNLWYRTHCDEQI